MSIGCVDNLKLFLGVTGNADDARYALFLDQANAGIKEYVGRALESTTYTEYYSGDGTRVLQLRQRPVTAVTSIYLDSTAYYGQASGAFAATTLLTGGVDYAIAYDTVINGVNVSRAGHVERLNDVWPLLGQSSFTGSAYGFSWQSNSYGHLAREPGFARGGNLKVTYVAGYTAATLPKDLELAVYTYASWLKRTAAFGGGQPLSESLGEYSYSLAALTSGAGSAEIGSIRQILGRYKDVVF